MKIGKLLLSFIKIRKSKIVIFNKTHANYLYDTFEKLNEKNYEIIAVADNQNIKSINLVFVNIKDNS